MGNARRHTCGAIVRSVHTAALLLTLAACERAASSDELIASAHDELLATAGVWGDSSYASEIAQVRLVNASPGAPQLSLRADSTPILSDIDYAAASAYTTVDQTWNRFQATTPGRLDWSTLDTNRERLLPGHRYSIIVLPTSEGNGYDTRVISDDLPLDDSKAIVRLVHAAHGVGYVSLHADGREADLFSGVDLGDEAGFVAIPPTTRTLQVRNEDGTLLASVEDTRFDRGFAYTLVLATNADRAPSVIWIRDAISR